jgi:hypothetical protein
MTITSGDATDHRPDVQPAVLALLVSHDGGVPCGSNSWAGHTSDIAVFQARARALRAAVPNAPSPRYLLADSTLSPEDQAPHRPNLGGITRIPQTIGAVSQVITPALTGDTWPRLDDQTRGPGLAVCHDGRAQRWLVVQSAAALARAEATRTTARPRATAAVDTPRFPLHATRVTRPAVAHAALAAVAKRWTYHQVASDRVIEHPHDGGTGRPTRRTPLQALAWPLQAHVRSDDDTSAHHPHVKACFGRGPTSDVSELSAAEVLAASKAQAPGEGGVRFRNDPRFVVASWLIKQPNRLDGLRRVMPLALLVDSVAQRRRRTP